MLASEIYTDAFREGNLKPIGTAPTTAEATEALARLNRLIKALYGYEAGEPLCEWRVPPPQRTASVAARYPLWPRADDISSNVWPYPPPNVRLMCSNATATTVYLPHDPSPGARIGFADVGMGATLTLNGNGRRIETTTTLAVTAGTAAREWFYRDDLGTWQIIADLQAVDTQPFAPMFDDLLVTGLAIMLSPRFGLEPRQATVLSYKADLSKFRARYHQNTAAPGGGMDIPPTQQGYYDGRNLLE
jgi:hypothetical protein